MRLYWHPYKYFPYEKELAFREVEQLTGVKPEFTNDMLSLPTGTPADSLLKLVYFSYFGQEGNLKATTQRLLESANESIPNSKRQSTRYSSHGLHEYKGKFNPQVVRSLLNIFSENQTGHVLDPFCGSGTTLVESVHSGHRAVGFDINPMAVFISNAKLKALTTDVFQLGASATDIIVRCREAKTFIFEPDNERSTYLLNWFPVDVYQQIENLRDIIQLITPEFASIFLVLVSNCLRDYSLQEPADLRIRRRASPFPAIPFLDAVERVFNRFVAELRATQSVLGRLPQTGQAILHDIRIEPTQSTLKESFDVAITSPPYATALPYIDTQRLSLVWLGLSPAKQINGLEETLIGSREFRKSVQKQWIERMRLNADSLPETISQFCNQLQSSLGASDGFRRQAVPPLLYRYFVDMKLMFINVNKLLKKGSKFCLVVGHNQTTIGGVKHSFDTPTMLVEVALSIGWKLQELTQLQAYQRYSLHSQNAINEESLIVLVK